MLFILFLSISQSIRSLETHEPATDTIPISVSIDQMDASTGECDTKECSTDNIQPDCGKRCLGTSSSHYFQYEFYGQQYQVYGSTGENFGDIKIYLNGKLAETVSTSGSSNPRTLLYTSPVLDFGRYTIKVDNGNNNTQYGIYKFAYWPSIKAKRINFTDDQLGGGGNWQKRTDNIGGITGWTNNQDSVAQSTIFCSRIWLYGAKDPGNGNIELTINRNNKFIYNEKFDLYAEKRLENCLIHDTKTNEFGSYLLKMTNPNRLINKDRMFISISCIFYEYDPPTQSPLPYPMQTLAPLTQEAFIDKEYHNYIPCGFPSFPLNQQSVVKKITGCKFYDIVSSGKFLAAPLGQEIEFSNNLFEYSDSAMSTTITYCNLQTKFTIDHCTFSNYKYLKKSGEGLIISFNQDLQLTFDTCTFNNIGQSDEHIMIKVNGLKNDVLFRSCTFYNDENNEGSKISNFITTSLKFEKCKFTRPARDMIKIDQQWDSPGSFTFIDNVVEKNKRAFIMANKIRYAPVIQNNVFQDINTIGGYLITFTLFNTGSNLELYNNTFQRIETKTDFAYGAGASMWYQNVYKNQIKLTIRQCKFYDITNNNELDPFNQGGAMHYGHTTSISNVIITFRNCEFKRNKCTYGSGGALSLNVQNNITIADCLFEDNQAKHKAGAIYFNSRIVKPADNPDAPDFDGNLNVGLISITNCQFKNNSAINGHVIYIEQVASLANTKLSVTDCRFTDNAGSEYMIYTQASELEFTSNTVEFTDKTKSSGIVRIPHEETAKSVTISDSNFNNCKYDQQYCFHLDCPKLSLRECHFTNFGSSGHIVNFVGNEADVDSCSFSFDNSQEACGAIVINCLGFKLRSSTFIKTNSIGAVKFAQKYSNENKEVLIEKCTFDQCVGKNLRCFDLSLYTVRFTFQDIVLQNHKESGESGYFIGISGNNYLKTLELINVTFLNNRCNSFYGGGSGIWFTDVEAIKFTRCKFINNIALKSPIARDKAPIGATEISYYSGDGGGVQYGFSDTIYNVSMIFDTCEFTENKAVRHGGALALQTVKDVSIIGCTFKNNVANFKEDKTARLLDYTNYFSKKTNGRGGAIYLNPAFNHQDMVGEDKLLHMTSVTIYGNKFEENSAFDGYAIYIQGEDPGTTFDIKNNQFIKNYNKDYPRKQDKSAILSEIPNISLPESNTFSYDQDMNIKPSDLSYGDPEETEDDSPDYFNVINITTHGRHDYVATDGSKLIIAVILSYFHDIKTTKDGGALYIKNAGLACNDITFVNCSTDDGKGGAIYIYNNFVDTNYANIITCNITDCSAKVGGGLFIYSDNKAYTVTVRYCTFTRNTVTAKSTDSLYGGSGAFIAAKKGRIRQNIFDENDGDGNVLMLTNNFDSVSQLLSQNNEKLIVSMNKFILLDSENGAVFYNRGKGGPIIEMSNCIFEGKLKNGRRFIEGKSISDNAPKMIIKNCKFEGDSSSAIQLDSDFLTVDLKQQVFDSESARIELKSSKKSQKKSALAIVVAVATVSVVAVVGFVIFFVKKVMKNDTDNKMSSDANDI